LVNNDTIEKIFMTQKIIGIVITILNRISGRSFLYVRNERFQQTGGTAVKDEKGIWHVGNVYNQTSITYGIAQNGHVEAAETKLTHLILGHLKEQSPITFYDIGANIGYYGIIAAAKYKAITHAFEPLEEYRHCLSDAIALNRTENNHFIHALALSDHTGHETFTIAGSGSSLEADFNENKNLPTISVAVDTLDKVVERQNIGLPNFIKIDVEGHELATLKGGQETISKSLPVVMIELCSSLEKIGRQYQNPHYEETIEYFNNKNYQIYLIKDEKTLIKWDKTQKVNYAAMFICLHKEKHQFLLENINSNFAIQ